MKNQDAGRRRKIEGNKEMQEPTSPPAILIGHPASLSHLSLCCPTSRNVTRLIGMRILEHPSI
jgi:hypothetical protein